MYHFWLIMHSQNIFEYASNSSIILSAHGFQGGLLNVQYVKNVWCAFWRSVKTSPPSCYYGWLVQNLKIHDTWSRYGHCATARVTGSWLSVLSWTINESSSQRNVTLSRPGKERKGKGKSIRSCSSFSTDSLQSTTVSNAPITIHQTPCLSNLLGLHPRCELHAHLPLRNGYLGSGLERGAEGFYCVFSFWKFPGGNFWMSPYGILWISRWRMDLNHSPVYFRIHIEFYLNTSPWNFIDSKF